MSLSINTKLSICFSVKGLREHLERQKEILNIDELWGNIMETLTTKVLLEFNKDEAIPLNR